jgi:hypothetical protein
MIMGSHPRSICRAAREIEALNTMQVHPCEQYCSDMRSIEDHHA